MFEFLISNGSFFSNDQNHDLLLTVARWWQAVLEKGDINLENVLLYKQF